MYALAETDEFGRHVFLSTFTEEEMKENIYGFCMGYDQTKFEFSAHKKTEEEFNALPNKLEIWEIWTDEVIISDDPDLEITFRSIQEITKNQPTPLREIHERIIAMLKA